MASLRFQFSLRTLFALTLGAVFVTLTYMIWPTSGAGFFGGMRAERWLDFLRVDDVPSRLATLQKFEGDSPAANPSIPTSRSTREGADDNDGRIYRRLEAQRHRIRREALELRGFKGITPSP
jgi:hypothetical protein